MRLSRVRFTVGTLLFAVAVVAANCWGFRHFYETDLYMGGRISYRLLPAGVGALPLFNVALIGGWLFVAKQLRLLRHGRAANPRSSSSGVTYFSLHFLMLLVVISLFMPDAIHSVQEVLEAATEYAAEGWGAVFGEPGGTVPWVIVESLIVGVFISGPPLLLSWVGQVLATRCAAALPRHRFRAMTYLVSLGFASAALAIAITPQTTEDEQEVDIDFQVVDKASGRPIVAAFLRMTDPFSLDPTSIPPTALTDAHGRARLRGRFIVRGERNAFLIMGGFSPWGRWLEISAADHRTLRVPLTEVLGPFADPARPGLGKVALDGGATRENPFRDLTGIYSQGGGFGGCWFKIEPDGRFAWCAWGCTFDCREYGYLKRHDREIELVPIPHPGEEIHPAMTLKYRAIEWGDRLYLSIADERALRGFCREALIPNRPSRSEDTYGSYLRQSDHDKPQVGLPRVPLGVWVKFLANELSFENEEGSLRLASAPSFQRSPESGRCRADSLLILRCKARPCAEDGCPGVAVRVMSITRPNEHRHRDPPDSDSEGRYVPVEVPRPSSRPSPSASYPTGSGTRPRPSRRRRTVSAHPSPGAGTIEGRRARGGRERLALGIDRPGGRR